MRGLISVEWCFGGYQMAPKISGLQVQLKEFSKTIRGYDISEVRSFLDNIAKQVEAMDFENKTLKDKIRERELNLMDYRDRELTLKETMVTAQKVTDGIKKDAQREAVQIVSQAKMRADNVLRQARMELRKTIEDINRLKKQRMELVVNIKTSLEAQLRMLEQMQKNDDTLVELNIDHNALS